MSLVNFENYSKLMAAGDTKEQFSRREFDGLDLNTCIDKLSYGTSIKKLRKRGTGSAHSVMFYIYEDDSGWLQWMSPHKAYWKSRIELRAIKDITERPMYRATKKMEKVYHQLLCIYHGTDGELLLVFDHPKDKYEWWCGLHYFIIRAQNTRGTAL